MKKTALLLLPLAMASCNYLGIPDGDVSGNILGTQPSGTIRMALRGTTLNGGQAPALDQGNLGTFNPQKRVYSISLPATPVDGGYELFAYVDSNGNNTFDSTEKRTSDSQTFAYSKDGTGSKSGENLLNLKAGWTQYKGATVVKSGTPFTSVDLNW